MGWHDGRAFVGDRWWAEPEEILDEIEPAVLDLLGNRSPTTSAVHGGGESTLVAMFERFGVATVAVAGLVDGINPCALAALVFLISFLSFSGRGPRQILATGLLFAAGVFLAYPGVGLGLFRGLQALSGFTTVSKLLYPLMAAGTAVLTGLSFRDFVRARAGDAGGHVSAPAEAVAPPEPRDGGRLLGGPGFLGLAFIAGAGVSILELFCTGQIYLPSLVYVASTDGLRSRAIPLLLLYVTMFTVPVLVLSIAAYAGVSSDRIRQWAQKHTASTKLALTLVFVVLTVGLVVFSLHVWGA